MIRSDEQWFAIADQFYEAAINPTKWYPALESLAAGTGSRSGQLITIGYDAAVPINLMTNIDPAANEAFIAGDGGDPAINPRVKAGMHAPVLQVLAERDFLTPEEHATHRHYSEFARPWDVPYICLTNLERRNDLLIGLAVLRSERQGHISTEQREAFASLAPHVRAAVRMQMSLEGQGAALLKGTLEALSLPAFVCGRSGAVQALTAQAEDLLREGRGLVLSNRQLGASNEDDDKALIAAIAKAARGLERPGAPGTQTVVVRTDDASPLVLDVMSLPSSAIEFATGPRALVVARGVRGTNAGKAAVLTGVYGFTSAETDVALQLKEGKTTEAIAKERKVSVGTVRAQIKSMLAKLGVSRQIELVAKLNEF